MKFFREPLVHFLLIGAALFGLFAWRGAPVAPVARNDQIVITPGLVGNLRTSFERSNGHAPDTNELEQAIKIYVREEILNREARSLGFDRDDSIVRRRLAQRMDFIATADVEKLQPTDEELRTFFMKTPDLFKNADGSMPDFAGAKEGVHRAWLAAQEQAAADAAYEKLRTRYTVVRQDQTAAQTK